MSNSLIMMVGLPGSGKTTYAKHILVDNPEYRYVSSDQIRLMLYGDETVQDNPKRVFEIMNNTTLSYLCSGYTVIYDATNLSKKYRKKLISKVPEGVDVLAYVMSTSTSDCIERDRERYRTVGEHIIRKMDVHYESPTLDEGFKVIKTIYDYRHDPILTVR